MRGQVGQVGEGEGAVFWDSEPGRAGPISFYTAALFCDIVIARFHHIVIRLQQLAKRSARQEFCYRRADDFIIRVKSYSALSGVLL